MITSLTFVCYKCKTCYESSQCFEIGSEKSCRKCFILYIESRFQKCLATKCKPRETSHLALALSGGESSLALLYLYYNHFKIKDMKNKRVTNASPKSMDVCHVNIASCFFFEESPSVEYCKTLQTLRYFQFAPAFCITNPKETSCMLALYVKNYTKERFIFHCIDPYRTLFYPEDVSSDVQRKLITQLFQNALNESKKNDSLLDDFLCILRYRCLFDWSKSCHKEVTIAFGDTADRITSEAFKCFTQGGGAHIPLLVNFQDLRFTASKNNTNTLCFSIRPLKQFSTEFMSTYTVLTNNASNYLVQANQFEKTAPTIDQFVHNLQKGNSQTIHIATQTLEKLSSICISSSCNSPNITFIYGQCECCFACLESPRDKLHALRLWTSHQLYCLGYLDEEIFCRLHIKNPLSYDVLQLKKKSSKDISRDEAIHLASRLCEHLCIRCSNLAASSTSLRDLVFVLAATGSLQISHYNNPSFIHENLSDV